MHGDENEREREKKSEKTQTFLFFCKIIFNFRSCLILFHFTFSLFIPCLVLSVHISVLPVSSRPFLPLFRPPTHTADNSGQGLGPQLLNVPVYLSANSQIHFSENSPVRCMEKKRRKKRMKESAKSESFYYAP